MKRIFNAVPREDGGWKIIEQMIPDDAESEEIFARSLQANRTETQRVQTAYSPLPVTDSSISTE
ncbi:MAG: hypothetical protein KDD67_16730 [Ignavibacteriae bacterium]|nr:hypothetical protein [Ignavibacteriota bacterium]MCB9217377.1 hypothetical protein [Ignavibacteria bacterium]